VYSAFISGFIYPVVCHWIWDPDGFMYGKVADFSGSGAVHLVGGAAAFSGAYFLGPRIGKFVKDEETGKTVAVVIPGHNAVLAAAGTLLLWFGFLPFNAGAGYAVAGEQGAINTGRAVVVTVLAGAAGACSLLAVSVIKFKQWDLAFAMNGLLAGMVASCSGVNVYDTGIAIVVGILAAGGFYVQNWLMENVLRIDDPLGAAALHMGAGIVGVISVGFFANPRYVDNDPSRAGVFYGGNGVQLGYQFMAVAVYFAWSFGLSSIMFWGLNRFGWLRVSEKCELMGLDLHHHGKRIMAIYFSCAYSLSKIAF
jgi:Amt family ammonium transporter